MVKVRELHNVKVHPVDTTGEYEFMFWQFSDANGLRYALHEPVWHKVSGKMPLVMVIEELGKAGEARYAEEQQRAAEHKGGHDGISRSQTADVRR